MTNTTASSVKKHHESIKAESCQTAKIGFLPPLSLDGKKLHDSFMMVFIHNHMTSLVPVLKLH